MLFGACGAAQVNKGENDKLQLVITNARECIGDDLDAFMQQAKMMQIAEQHFDEDGKKQREGSPRANKRKLRST